MAKVEIVGNVKVSPVLVEDLKNFLKDNELGISSQAGLGRSVDLSQAQISSLLGEKYNIMHFTTLKKICDGLEWDITRYYKGKLPSSFRYSSKEDNLPEVESSDFRGVVCYDLGTGITYIGIPKNKKLEQACVVPTKTIADQSFELKMPYDKTARQIYDSFRKHNGLSDINEFSPLEVIATNYLGKMIEFKEIS